MEGTMIVFLRILTVCIVLPMGGQLVQGQGEVGRLGILLDTSPEMGAIVPQVRKEVRLLNEKLKAIGRAPVVLHEFSGAALAPEGSFSVPGTKNVWYAIKELFNEKQVDGIYWITALKGMQSGRAMFELGELLESRLEEKPDCIPLTIRNIWQEQVQEGVEWILEPPGQEIDPLGDTKFPSEWFDVLSVGQGYLIRSWMVAPHEFVAQFGYPPRIVSPYVLRVMNIEQRSVSMDTRWATTLDRQYGLRFVREDEVWADSLTGRGWFEKSTLTPFFDEETLATRNEVVFADLCRRESIEQDLQRVDGNRVGILFGFGFLEKDLERFKSMPENKRRDSRMRYISDMSQLVNEARQHMAAYEPKGDRIYQMEFVELQGLSAKLTEEDRYAFAMARLVREEEVDAIYLFTNGYTGGREYGRFRVNVPLMAAAIREAGVKLYVRVPYETGVVPMDLQQLAIASGGGVFQGAEGDEDWAIEMPKAKWPEEVVTE